MKSNKNHLAILFFIFWTAVSASGQNNQTILPLSWPGYEHLNKFLLETGLPPSFGSKPYSADEVRRYLDRVDPNLLSEAGKKSYYFVLESLKTRTLFRHEEGFGINAALEVNIEGYYHTNYQADWIYGYEERLPLLKLPIDAWFLDSIYANFTASVKEEFQLADPSVTPANYSNIITGGDQIDMYFPFRALVAWGGRRWNLVFGRDKLEFGNGYTGNLFLSDYADFYDFLRLTTYWDVFKFTAVYIVLDPDMTDAEKLAGTMGDKYFDPNNIQPYKAFFAHRIEFTLFGRLNLAINEALVFGGRLPELRDLNPLMILHNWFHFDDSNAIMSLEAELNPYRWISLYGQVVIDEFVTPYEKAVGSGDDRPGALGYILGGATFIPLGSGYLELGWEWARTDPWLYNRWHPLTRLTSRRHFYSNYLESMGWKFIDKALGYYTGPDSIVLSFRVGYGIPGLFDTLLEYRIVTRGEQTLDTPYVTEAWAHLLTTPTGTAEQSHIVRLHGDVELLPMLSLASDLYWVAIIDHNHSAGGLQLDFQVAASVQFRL